MKIFSFPIIFFVFLTKAAFAGGSLGGGGALQLEQMALSETMLASTDLREAMGSSAGGGGAIIEVQSSDFTIVTTDAAQGKDLMYRDTPVRAAAVDTQAKVLILHPVEDPSITVIVKDAGSK